MLFPSVLYSLFRLSYIPYNISHLPFYTYLPVVRPHAPSARPVGGPYLGDDDAAVAAAIGASLDMLGDHGDNAISKPNKPNTAGKRGDGDDDGDGVGVSVGVSGGGGGGVGGGVASAPPPRPGSNASQDLAFLTDAPLLPPAGAGRRGEPTDTDAAGQGRSGGGQGGREISGGGIIFGEGEVWVRVVGGVWRFGKACGVGVGCLVKVV